MGLWKHYLGSATKIAFAIILTFWFKIIFKTLDYLNKV